MSLGRKLEELLAEKVLESQAEGTVTLRERQRESRMRISVATSSVPVTAIRLSKTSHSSLLRDGPTKRVCDYLLIFALDGIDYAVFIELKKTLSDKHKPREQLRRSLPFLAYLCSVCSVEYGNAIDSSRVCIRYFRVGEKLSERFDRQFVRVVPNRIIRREEYKDIVVNTLIGPRITLATLSRA